MSRGKNEGARAVADTGTGTILATVDIAAPMERVFRALTTDEVTQWWGSPELYRTTAYEADLRPGGRWRSSGIGVGGNEFSVEGEFREIDPPHKLVLTWVAAWDGGHETVVTYRLEAIAGGTRLTLRHEGFGDRVESCRGHGEGWGRVLGWLAHHAGPVDDGATYFFCKLVAPRPTFATDMSEDEAAMMREHAAYWRGLLDRGAAVVFGPVGDPAGAWGLGVVRASGEDEMGRLRDADPAIRAGLGFRYDIAPMIRAVSAG